MRQTGPRARDNSVLVLAKGFPPTPGGVEQYSQQLTAAYVRAGKSVTVLTQTELAPGWADARPLGYRLWNAGPGSQLIVFVRMLRTALALRKSSRFEFVHATTWRVALVALLVFRRVPLVVTVHGREVMNASGPLAVLMRRVLAHARLLVCVSAATLGEAKRALGRNKTRGEWVVSYNGLTFADDVVHAAAPHDPGDHERLRILSLSRLVPRKNVHGAIAALAQLKDEGVTDFELRVAGKGPEFDALRQLADAAGLTDQISFLGYVPDEDVPRLYEWADVFLHPHTHVGEGNDFEGFGIVIADAMAFGCAVIAGDIGGPRELVTDGIDGLLVDGGNTADIAAAIRRLVCDRSLASALGAAAAEVAPTRFNWDRHAASILSAAGVGR